MDENTCKQLFVNINNLQPVNSYLKSTKNFPYFKYN